MLARKALAGTAAAPKIYVEDVFSTYLYTGNGTGNFIENGINLGNANSSGSAYFDGTGDYLSIPSNSVFNLGTGDFTVEAWVYRTGTGTGYETILGFDVAGGLLFELFGGELDYGIRATANNKSGTAVPSFQWVHLAISRQSGTVRYFQNGSLINTYTGTYATQDFTNNTAALVSSYSAGAGVFNGYISNLRLVKGTAVYTSAFTPSTSQLTAISGTSLLLLQGSSPFVDNSGNALSVTAYADSKAKSFGPFTGSTSGEGGLVWIKNRDQSSGVSHCLFDTERGAAKILLSNATNAQITNQTDSLTSFNADGFTLGADSVGGNVNTSTFKQASWTFRKAKKFFDVVTFTTSSSTNTNQRISHNLGSTPGTIIVKNTGGTSAWPVWHRSLASATDSYLTLNGSGSTSTYTNCWGTSGPTSTDFGINTNFFGTSANYVAYVFAHDAGGFGDAGSDSIIKCGSFSANFNANVTVDLGWEPQWLVIKDTANAQDWLLLDNMRGMFVTGNGRHLAPNTTAAEGSATWVEPTATGFIARSGQFNTASHIYIAIRRGPMKTPTSGTSVFKAVSRAGTSANATITSVGFPPDLLVGKETVNNWGYGNLWFNKLAGPGKNLRSQSTAAEDSTTDALKTFDQDGVSLGNDATNGGLINGSGSTYINWLFRRAPGFFDVVCYTGTGSATTVSHNLGVAPEFMIVKRRSTAEEWAVYAGEPTKYLALNSTAAFGTGTRFWNDTAPTNSVFTVGDGTWVNTSSATYVAYLFASVSGVSKVGTYTGNGSSQTINCNFTNGARFILIKRTDSTGEWYVWDTVQGIVSGNDPYLRWNSSGGQVTGWDSIDPDNSGFVVNQDAQTGINASSATYIYLAIA